MIPTFQFSLVNDTLYEHTEMMQLLEVKFHITDYWFLLTKVNSACECTTLSAAGFKNQTHTSVSQFDVPNLPLSLALIHSPCTCSIYAW